VITGKWDVELRRECGDVEGEVGLCCWEQPME
jgi:hypothetical protein